MPGYSVELTAPAADAFNPLDQATGCVERVIGQISPDAGSAYLAIRAWNVLIWQPVLVSLICAEAEGCAAEVESAGYRLEPQFSCHMRAAPRKTIDVRREAARHLRAATVAIFELLSERLRLRAELARRQMADRVLAILARRAMLGFSGVDSTRAAGAEWLTELDLDGLSALEPLPLDDGADGLWLCRRSCCLEYRAIPDFLCATCPRRDRADRIALSKAEWQDHVRA